MKPVTGRTLVVASAISLVLGLAVMSPSAGFFLTVLAALLAAAPVLRGQGKLRIAAAALLILSLVLVAFSFSSFQADQRAYRERAVKTR